jgi:hypothetical protein
MAKRKEKVEEAQSAEPVVQESVETFVEESNPVQELETFKAQLLQAFELNDKLLHEVESRDKEITVFKEVKMGLERVIEQQQSEITQLKEHMNTLRLEKFNEQVTVLARKWIKKYGQAEDKLPEVVVMLSKFQNEEELSRMEKLLGLETGNENSNPTPLTQTSANLVEVFSSPKSEKNLEQMSPDEKRNYFWKQMETLKKRFPQSR